MKLTSKQIVSVDWLQLYCSCNNLVQDKDYDFQLMSFQTKQFRQLYEVSYRGEEFAQITCKPVSNIIPADTYIVKIKNRQLYGTDIVYVVNCFLHKCNIRYNAITRVDFAIDFQKFRNGLYPKTFIQRFLSCEYLKNGRGKFTLIGEQKFTHDFQYIRFGSKTSDVNVYLYNKTKELQQVQDKPYIRAVWALMGLSKELDVWRLEISIKGMGSHYVDKETGQMSRITVNNLNDSNYLSNIFFSYLNQYFEFKVNDNTKNKTRMQTLQLFDFNSVIYKPLYLPKETGSNRSDKIFVKKLYMLDQELRGLDSNAVELQKQLFIEVMNDYDLVDYVKSKREIWKRKAFKAN